MKNKLIYPIGIVVLLNLIVSGIIFFKGDAPEAILGGTTNLDSLELSEDLTVADDATITDDLAVTDDLTVSGDATITANTNSDGGLILGGSSNLGNTASSTFTATQICDYNLLRIKPTTGAADSGDDSERGASMSFPSDETLEADCLGSTGDNRVFYIDNTSSGSAYLDFDNTDIALDFVSKSADFNGDNLIRVNIVNIDGSSLSYKVEIFQDLGGD